MSSALGLALTDSLTRLVPPRLGATERATAEAKATRETAVMALAEALEQGELGLDLNGPAPDGLEANAWPNAVVTALKVCGWLVTADVLNAAPEAPFVLDGHWLRWRR